MRTKIYRQGDVLIERIARFPKGERVVQKDGILAHGEATGHTHRLSPSPDGELFNLGTEMFLEVRGDVAVTHDEHDPVRLDQGKYRVRRQREYHPEAIRNVAD